MPSFDEVPLSGPKNPPADWIAFLVGFLACAGFGVAGTLVAAVWLYWAVKRRGADRWELGNPVVWGVVLGLAIAVVLDWFVRPRLSFAI